MIQPNLAQELALESLNEGFTKSLVVLPSGVGKTYLSAFATKNSMGRILYVVHRNEIVEQARNSFIKVNNLIEDDVSIVNADSKDFSGKYVFATIQTLSRRKTLKIVNPKYFDYIIIDEYHHVAALTYKRLLNYFRPKKLLGMTATPFRLDGKDIMKFVDNKIAFNLSMRDAIDKGLLVPFEYHGFWDDIDYSDIKFRNYKYKESDLDKKLIIDRRNEAVIKEYKNFIDKKPSIGFCCSVKHVNYCVKKFNEAGIRAIGISYETDHIERRRIIEDFHNGRYDIIFTRDIFNEGVDFPEVEGLLFLRPTFSKTIFLQQLGRGLRTREGKEKVTVLDFIGNYINAYKSRIWLKEIIGGEGSRPQKPEYKYNLPSVHFDSKVIDLFEAQEKMIVTDEKLIQEFYRLKEKFGRNPKIKEFDNLSVYHSSAVCARWGSWTGFLKHLNEQTNMDFDVSKKELINNYLELKKD